MDEIASSAVLDSAFAWLCQRRIDYADSADVWNVRRWAEIKPQLQRDLLAGRYRFQPLRRIRTVDGECIELWAALDALVLKALAIVQAGFPQELLSRNRARTARRSGEPRPPCATSAPG